MTPRRNDACPCGSGRKYKHCCGAAATEGAAWTPADLETAFLSLADYVDRPELDLERAEAFTTFWSAAPESLDFIELKGTSVGDALEQAFVCGFALDRREDGSSLLDEFLAKRSRRLPERARLALAALGETQLDLHRVVSSTPTSIRLAGTLAPGERDVRTDVEPSLVSEWVAARLLTLPDGTVVMGGEVLPFPGGFDGAPLAAALPKVRAEEGPSAVARTVVGDLLDALLAAGLIERREIAAVESYQVLVTSELVRALDACDELDVNTEGDWLWIDDSHDPEPGKPLIPEVVAKLQLEGDRLDIVVYDEAELEHARSLLQELAGDLVVPRADDDDDFEDLDAAEEGDFVPALPDIEILPARAAAFLYTEGRKALLRWAGEPLTELGGRTPRDAAADPSARAELERILAAAAGKMADDDAGLLPSMRRELGLE